ncbi:CTP synthetase [uncultured Roseobacter sp.]|uniref:CTP synthetase n=1 Tax=uncultured Roseobacter sp. TaxID=114847 RepID=UPI00260D82A6|nr:CTP synthetase [uncultured Roseobacter sp.]
MFRLTAILYCFIAATLAGSGVIAVLSAGMTDVLPIVIAAAAGAVLALPASYLVARKIGQ